MQILFLIMFLLNYVRGDYRPNEINDRYPYCVNQHNVKEKEIGTYTDRYQCRDAIKAIEACSDQYLHDSTTGQCACLMKKGHLENSKPDKIFINGNIHTFDEEEQEDGSEIYTMASTLVVKDGYITAIGDMALSSIEKGPNTEIIDLKGQTVLPGFIDPHSHFTSVGVQQLHANVLPPPDGNCNSVQAIIDSLKTWKKDHEDIFNKTGIIFGMGYDESLLIDGRKPNRYDLDAVSTTEPVMISHISMHGMVLNTVALEIFNYTNHTKAGPGGAIGRVEKQGIIDAIQRLDPEFQGTPDGVLDEEEMRPPYAWVLNALQDYKEDVINAAVQSYAGFGYTTVQEGVWTEFGGWIPHFVERGKQDRLYIDLVAYGDAQSWQRIYEEEICQHSFYDDPVYSNKFRCAGMKLVLDGSPQMKTAYMLEPYMNPPDGEDEDYVAYARTELPATLDMIHEAVKNEFQLTIHANGDAAIAQLIKAVRNVTATLGGDKILFKDDKKTNLLVAIHSQMLTKGQVKEYDELGIFPALFPMHTFYWGDWHANETFGIERAERVSPCKEVLEEIGYFTSHTDAPVGAPDAWRVLSATTTRRTRTNILLGGDNRVSLRNAIRSTTDWAALQYKEEKIKGTLEVGKMADMVVLNEDIFDIDEKGDEWIRDTIYNFRENVTATYKMGNRIHPQDQMKYNLNTCAVYDVNEVRTNSMTISEAETSGPECPSWCKKNGRDWDVKCAWDACSVCYECVPDDVPETYNGCQDITDPCECTGNCGWSSSHGSCMSGSTTNCVECPSLDMCIEGTCDSFNCPSEFEPMHSCQCEPKCVEYDNCCDDYESECVPRCENSCYSNDKPFSTKCGWNHCKACGECGSGEMCEIASCSSDCKFSEVAERYYCKLENGRECASHAWEDIIFFYNTLAECQSDNLFN